MSGLETVYESGCSVTSKLSHHCERRESSALSKAALQHDSLEGCISRAFQDDFFQHYQLAKCSMKSRLCYSLGGSYVAPLSLWGWTKGHCHLRGTGTDIHDMQCTVLPLDETTAQNGHQEPRKEKERWQITYHCYSQKQSWFTEQVGGAQTLGAVGAVCQEAGIALGWTWPVPDDSVPPTTGHGCAPCPQRQHLWEFVFKRQQNH